MLSNIQMLCAFAAIVVVCFHTTGIAASYGHATSWPINAVAWGISGVDIFFVISGFLMVHIQLARPKGMADFLGNRVMRIVPIYWILTLTVLVLQLAMPSAFRSDGSAGLHAVYSLLFVSTFVSGPPVLYVGWTLEYEMFFYLLFALGICSGRVERGVSFVALALVAAVVANILRPVALEFLIGMLLALWLGKWTSPQPKVGWWLMIAGVAGLASGACLMQSWSVREVFFGIPAFFLVAGCVVLPQLHSPFGIMLGNASYAIYLVQVLTLPASRITAALNDLVALCSVIATVAFGVIVHIYVEAPVARLLRDAKDSKAPAV